MRAVLIAADSDAGVAVVVGNVDVILRQADTCRTDSREK